MRDSITLKIFEVILICIVVAVCTFLFSLHFAAPSVKMIENKRYVYIGCSAFRSGWYEIGDRVKLIEKIKVYKLLDYAE